MNLDEGVSGVCEDDLLPHRAEGTGRATPVKDDTAAGYKSDCKDVAISFRFDGIRACRPLDLADKTSKPMAIDSAP